MTDILNAKRAVVTGGAHGIGRAIVEELAMRGCEVIATYLHSRDDAQALSAWAEQKQATLHLVQADLTRPDGVEALTALVRQRWDGMDVLVNNAGNLVARNKLAEVDDAFWHQVMDINVTSMMGVTRACAPWLEAAGRKDGASVVNMASLAGRQGGHAGSLVYSTAKGAVLSWTRALAAEWGPSGIRVNAVAPGLILGTRFHDTHTTAESAAATVAGIPLGRAGTSEDVARAVAFLASEYNGFITGATIDINGGVYRC
jgi:3-oxoacyl-[acyl-carrier protein] reductase